MGHKEAKRAHLEKINKRKMKFTLFATFAVASATATPAMRDEIISKVNSVGTTWTAGVSPR